MKILVRPKNSKESVEMKKLSIGDLTLLASEVIKFFNKKLKSSSKSIRTKK